MLEINVSLVDQLLEAPLAQPEVFRVARQLHEHRPARLVEIGRRHVKAIVRSGGREYSTHIIIGDDDSINLRCHCTTVVMKRRICAHLIATLYALHDHLHAQHPSSPDEMRRNWTATLDRLLSRRSTPRPNKLLIPLFSLSYEQHPMFGYSGESNSFRSLNVYVVPVNVLAEPLADLGIASDTMPPADIVHSILDTHNLWARVRPLKARERDRLVPGIPEPVLNAIDVLLISFDHFFFYSDTIAEVSLLLLRQAPDVLIYMGGGSTLPSSVASRGCRAPFP
ncbi:MAG: hypothetical protein Q9O62_14535 [Ardenticatenia bacterium]|nr:hypothetical protein [Ardenticatenia bacterium]